MWATDKDNLEMVELLLANNADPNIKAKVCTIHDSIHTQALVVSHLL